MEGYCAPIAPATTTRRQSDYRDQLRLTATGRIILAPVPDPDSYRAHPHMVLYLEARAYAHMVLYLEASRRTKECLTDGLSDIYKIRRETMTCKCRFL
jgi:hypothetical protein